MNDGRIWTFIYDMNSSGSTTISDIWLWILWFYFYPGDFILSRVISETPKFANFFEITYNSYSGFLSGVISLTVWGFLILGVTGIILQIRDIPKAIKEMKKPENIKKRKENRKQFKKILFIIGMFFALLISVFALIYYIIEWIT